MTHNIIYHNQDLDGFCSGAIIKYHLLNLGANENSIRMIGWNYGDPMPLLEGGSAYITDICFPDNEMIRLKMRPDIYLVWIDHHKTSIEVSEKSGWSDIEGLRVVGDSASFLAWKYYFPHLMMPDVVRYVDLYDTWKKKTSTSWQEIMEMQFAMRFYLKEPNKKLNFDCWMTAFEKGVEKFHDSGKMFYQLVRNQNEVIAKTSFDLLFEGFLFRAVNYKGNSEVLNPVIHPRHDAIMMFYYDINQWRVSLYANESNLINTDLSVIAKKFGGGGHAKACGFEIDDINNIINKKPISAKNTKTDFSYHCLTSKEKFSRFAKNLGLVTVDYFDLHNLSKECGSLAEAIQFVSSFSFDGWMWEREGNILTFTKE